MNSKTRSLQVLARSSRVVLPACDGFVCSQERIKAIELANRGAEEFKNNLYDSAEKDLKQAIQTDPSYEIAYYNLGKVFRSSASGTRPSSPSSRPRSGSPTTPTTSTTSARPTSRSKKLDQAEKALQAATERRPEAVQGLVAARAWSTRSSTARRRRTTRSATPSRPTRASRSPYVALGYLYLDYDFNKEAAQVFQGCVTAKDDDGECHNGYGLALKNLKQYEQATSEFKKAIDLDPELYDALYNAGMAYSDWFDEAHGNDQKEQGARVPAEVRRPTAARSADGNYVKAANDKLYALSGP